MKALLNLFATGMVGKILQKFVPRTVAVSGVPHSPAVAHIFKKVNSEWGVVN